MTTRITSASASLMEAPPRWTNNLIRGIALAIVVFFVWAAWAEVDEVIFSAGKVIPAGDVQVVQNLEGGIVSELFAHVGNRIKKGDLLLRIDNSGSSAQLGENRQRLLGIEGQLARFDAEINDKPLSFPPELLQEAPDIARREQQLYITRQEELGEVLRSLTSQKRERQQEYRKVKTQAQLLAKNITLMREEVTISQDLVEQGALSKVEMLQLQRKLNELQSERQSVFANEASKKAQIVQLDQQTEERRNKFLSDVVTKRNELEIQRSEIKEKIVAAVDRVSRTEVRSPVNGTVNRILVNTIGGVVKPGMDLVEIVPLDETLLIEGRVKPEDIAFLTLGQRAVVRLTAYDFAIFGSLEGELETISANTIEGENGEQFYQIRVRTKENFLSKAGKTLPILPGMIANIDVITGKRTILNYLTTPITKTKQRALRER